jgi:phage baseplate assembly protein W
MATTTISVARTYRDLDLNFGIHPIRKDINTHKGEYAVINSIKNIIQTNHYEVPFEPEFGSNIRKLLFEPMDAVTSNLLEREISETVRNFEPRARVSFINVKADYEKSGYLIEMTFDIISLTNAVTIKFFLERVR